MLLDGTGLTRFPPHEVPKQGIAYAPQGRRLFANLSVAENLEIGMLARSSRPQTLQDVLAAKVTTPYDAKTAGGSGSSADRFVTAVYQELKGQTR